MPMPKPERVEPFAVAGVGDLAPELKAQLAAHARRRPKRRAKATYDLPSPITKAVKAAADREQVAQSDIVAYALAEWLDKYTAGQVDLSDTKIPCRGPRFELSLQIPAKWRR